MPTPTPDRLTSSLRGDLIQPADPSYESTRRVYNAMIDKKPSLVARCADVADVMADRLARIKKQYDPANFFRVNQNIRPSA